MAVMDLQINLPHPTDADLVRRCIQYLNPETEAASVRPLGRYGYTASRLLSTVRQITEGSRSLSRQIDLMSLAERQRA